MEYYSTTTNTDTHDNKDKSQKYSELKRPNVNLHILYYFT